jgi:glutathione S-transferase
MSAAGGRQDGGDDVADDFTLYGIGLSGPTYKVALMLTLSGQRYAYKHVNLMDGSHRKPEYLALNRFGVVPALQHGDLTLSQSGAILEYLADTLGTFRGDDEVARIRAREWLFYDADVLSPAMYRCRAIRRGFLKAEAPVEEHFRGGGGRGLKLLDRSLADAPFLAGKSPTVADIACYGAIWFYGEAGYDLEPFANLTAWMDRIAALPHYKAPYDLLPMQDAAA